MAQHNKFDCIGRLGRDPEKKDVSSSGSIVSASIAVSDGYWDKKKEEWVDDTDWFDIKGWGNFGKKLLDFKKGDQVVVMGAKVKVEKWEDPETGKKMQKPVIQVVPGTTIAFLAKPEPRQAAAKQDDGDDSLPF